MTRRRRISPWVVVFLVLVINLPVAHSSYLDWRLDRSGVEVTAVVTSAAEDDGSYGIEFAYGPDIDPEGTAPRYSARVDRATYERATSTRTVDVRVLTDRPSAYAVHGEVTTDVVLVVTVLIDLVLLGLVGLSRYLRRRRPEEERLHLVALEDVQRCRPGGSLVRLDESSYDVSGEVCLIDDTGLELDVDGRRVRVDLAGHHNPVGYQQPGRVRARLSDWPA